MKAIALTGHRILKKNFDYFLLEEKLKNLIDIGYTKFYCGMAIGFDMTCAGLLLRLKKRNTIELIACIPCKKQEEKYTYYDKVLYYNYLKKFDKVIYIEENFTKSCMFKRNRFLVDNSDLVFAYLYKERGGTYYTVEYAKKREKKIEYF